MNNFSRLSVNRPSIRPLGSGVLSGVLLVVVWMLVQSRAGASDVSTRQQFSPRSEIILRLVVSSSCSFSRDPSLPDLVQEAVTTMRSVAEELGIEFGTSAVSIESEPKEGIEFLTRFGPFEEISVGRGWVNTVVIDHSVSGPGDHRSTPQVIVLRRRVDVAPHEDVDAPVGMTTDIVLRAVGVPEVERLTDRQFVRKVLSE